LLREMFPDALYDAGASLGEILIRDLNQDGIYDLVFSSTGNFDEALGVFSYGVSVMLGRAEGGFAPPTLYELAAPFGITSTPTMLGVAFNNPWTLEGLDGDGFLDLLFAPAMADDPHLTILLNDGAGNFELAQQI